MHTKQSDLGDDVDVGSELHLELGAYGVGTEGGFSRDGSGG